MDPIIKLMEEQNKEDKARSDSRKKALGKAFNYTGKAAKYIGFRGAVGGLAGLALAGPVGGLVGIVAGKNSKRIYGASKDFVVSTYNVWDKAGKYEELNQEARYEPAQYGAGARNFHKNIIKYIINKTKGIKSKLDNCREYAKLENEAEKISAEKNVKISAEDLFKAKKREKEIPKFPIY